MIALEQRTTQKLTGPIEMSDLPETDHGPGRFVLCIRGVDLKYRRVRTYAVFFDDNDYKGSLILVMIRRLRKAGLSPVPLEGRPVGGAASPGRTK
jgi:hypothetical protein